MKQDIWKNLIKSLPPNLTVAKVAQLFRRSITLTRRRLKENGYKAKEKKKYRMPQWAANADWTQPNIVIARKYGLTRERVRAFRKFLGHPKVECRGRKK